MTDLIGERGEDVEQVCGRAHQPVEAGTEQAKTDLTSFSLR